MNTLVLTDEELGWVTGGTVNENMTPDGPSIDDIFNDENYDRVADKIVEWLYRNDPNSSYTRRSREVNNNVDIYDFD